MELLMSFSIQRETSDGTLSTLDLTIEYIDKTDVKAFVNDVEIELAGGATPYTWEWITPAQIKITPNVPNGLVAMVKRSTPMDAMYHVYDAGAVFKDETVDENFKQVLFLSQEAKEGSGVSDIYSNVNMHGYVIGNHGAAILDGDLVTFGQYRNDSLGSSFNRVAAEAARDVAVASKDLAVTSANNAAVSEAAANVSAVNAGASEAAALADRILAQDAANTAVSAYDSFDDRYLGAKAADPALDNDGAALLEGALYWNSTVKEMRVYNGVAWVVAYLPADGYLEKNQNLADLQSTGTALINLGLDAVDNTADADKPVSTPQRDFIYARAGSAGSPSSRNKIINGKMEIAQRGLISNTGGYQTVDRFTLTSTSGTANQIEQSRQLSGPNPTLLYSYQSKTLIADPTLSGRWYALRQVIEGSNVVGLVGQPFTLSFYVRASKIGTYTVCFNNNVGDRYFLAEYSVTTPNTWEYKTITVSPGLITAGGWDWGSGVGLHVYFMYAADAAQAGVVGSWQVGAKLASPNQVNCMDAVGNIFAITGVQLEAGEVATQFEHRPYGLELALCQRYFCTFLCAAGAAYPTAGGALATSGFYFPVQMRAIPSLTFGASGGFNLALEAFENRTVNGGRYIVNQGPSAGNYLGVRIGNTADAEL